MKAVLNETKRILAVMLSVAMIIAAVPQAAFAETPSGNDADDPVIQTEEDGVANEAAETVVEDATETPTDEEIIGEKEALDAIQRAFKVTGSATIPKCSTSFRA